jgi:hypothetical protein
MGLTNSDLTLTLLPPPCGGTPRRTKVLSATGPQPPLPRVRLLPPPLPAWVVTATAFLGHHGVVASVPAPAIFGGDARSGGGGQGASPGCRQATGYGEGRPVLSPRLRRAVIFICISSP